MQIVFDAMGSDTYPDPEVQAAVIAGCGSFGDEILLVGHEEQLKPKLASTMEGLKKSGSSMRPKSLEMSDKPSKTARGKARTPWQWVWTC